MKKPFLLIMIMCGLMLTGCAQLTKLDDNQSDQVAEYMASTVLRYSKNYEEALIYPVENHESAVNNVNASINDSKPVLQGESKEAKVEDSKTKDTNTKGSEKSNVTTINKQNYPKSLDKLFKSVGDNKYSVSYTGYTSHTSYPEDKDYFTIEPAKGNKLLVFSFNIKNSQNKNLSIDLVNKKIEYTLKNTSGRSYNPGVTLLTNDIQYLKSTIKANKSLKAVLVFEVSKEINDKDLSLVINYGDNNSVININK